MTGWHLARKHLDRGVSFGNAAILGSDRMRGALPRQE
jgi:hypothetical protein